MTITRRAFITAAAGMAAASAFPFGEAFAAAPEKKNIKIAVGGQQLVYYLPLTIADRLGYFRDEGLNVSVIDFQGGSKSLQAVVGGSADICSGAFEHTVIMQTRGQRMQAFVLQGRAPQCVFAANLHTMKNFRSAKELKGKRIGVTAPGSSSQIMANYCLKAAGIKPNEVSIIGIGSSSGAIAAIRSGQVDAFVQLDPVISMLMEKKEIAIIADTRKVAESDRFTADLWWPAASTLRNPLSARIRTRSRRSRTPWCAPTSGSPRRHRNRS